MKKYLIYELKNKLIYFCVIAGILFITYIVPLLLSFDSSYVYSNRIEYLTTFSAIIAFFMPVDMLKYRMKKRSTDLYYALPLSHKKILSVKYITGLIAIYAPYTVAFILGALISYAKWKLPSMVWFVPLYFASLIPLYIIYSFSSFIFSRANTSADGILFVIMASGAFAAVYTVLSLWFGFTNYSEFYTVASPLAGVSEYFTEKLTGNSYGNYISYYSSEGQANMIAGYIIVTLVSIACSVGLFMFESRVKAENSGQISDSYFGYKTMIPLYTVCFTAMLGYLDLTIGFILWIVLAFFTFLVTTLYRRSFKIGKKCAIYYGATMAVAFVIMIISAIV